MNQTQQTEKKTDRVAWLTDRGCQFRDLVHFTAQPVVEDTEHETRNVEGLVTPFDTSTVLYEWDGVEYREQIAAGAFDGADLHDVVFNYNHGGKVMARTRNNTLQLWTEADGLHMRANLDGTEEGRRLYEEIRGGYIDRMSFAFQIAEAAYDTETRTRTILRVKKVFDVSAVDIPAYDTTFLNARNAFAVEIAKEERAAAAAALRREVILADISMTLNQYKNGGNSL